MDPYPAAKAEQIYKDAKDVELIKKEVEGKPFFEQMKKWNPDFKFPVGLNVTQYGWSDVSGLGSLCSLFVIGEKGGSVIYEELKADFLKKSAEVLTLVKESG